MTPQGSSAPAPVVWLLHDDKPGHLNQLRGVGNRLRVLAGADVRQINANDVLVPLWRTLLGLAPMFDAPDKAPDLIIAAGHGTHRLLLALRRKKNAKTAVLMKPSFPLGWVDAVIAPTHDNLKPNHPHLLLTEGVINAITPMAGITDKPEALVLMGGPSDHFQWEDDVIIGQLSDLMGRYTDWRWTLSGSRRTPKSLLNRLQDLAGLKVTVVDHNRTNDGWLAHQLASSRAVWVTPDSGSMVCEAITSGIPTGLFELSHTPESRIAKSVTRLLEQGYVASWTNHASVMSGKLPKTRQLWEADRAARWLIDTLLPGSAL